MNDLWPKEFEPSEIETPITILKEQASFLANKTNNMLKAEVVQTGLLEEIFGKSEPKKFYYVFYIVAPALDNYRYALLNITYPLDSYPVYIFPSIDISKEFPPAKTGQIEAISEEEFKKYLKLIFNSEETKRIIGAILSQMT